MKRIIACLSLLITVMSCESDKFEYSPDELSGVFKPNSTADLSVSYSCVAFPNTSFGGAKIRLEKYLILKLDSYQRLTFGIQSHRNPMNLNWQQI